VSNIQQGYLSTQYPARQLMLLLGTPLYKANFTFCFKLCFQNQLLSV